MAEQGRACDEGGAVVIMHLAHLDHAVTGTPEGLSRVEYRYARFLLERGGDTIWVRYDRTHEDLIVVPEEQVRSVVARIAERWQVGGAASSADAATALSGRGMIDRWIRRLRFRVRELDEAHHLRVLLRRAAGLGRSAARRWIRATSGCSSWRRRATAEASQVAPTRRGKRRLLTQYLDGLPEPLRARGLCYLDVSQQWVPDLPGLQRLRSEPGFHQVAMLHDLIPIDAPELTPGRSWALHFERSLCRMLDSSPTAMTNSAYTATRLQAYVARRGLPVPHIVVNELGTELADLDRDGVAEQDPVQASFVTLGTIGPHKNHALLLTIWRHLLDEGYEPGVLEIVGRRWPAPATAWVLDLLDHPGRLQPWLREHSALGDHDLVGLLRRSRALLLPSFMEGWGMPVAEALSLGVPVICSDLPSFREIGGDIPRYLSPLDGLGWRQAVLDYRDPDHPDRQRQLALLADGAFRPRTWDEHLTRFEQVVLAQAADHRDTPPP